MPALCIKYDREIFTLEDGGTLALEWFDGVPDANDGDQRPILVCIAGLGSNTQATYVKRMINEMSREFKCVFIQFRAQGGVPVTSPKIYCMGVWTDIKEPIDYIS